ncbi:MAG: hypothetical protein KAS32_06920 [Candidatus Peribacteraceae bacterium]|nr:hypothetical protein [Candidatus Peribacteraceae bacterium]
MSQLDALFGKICDHRDKVPAEDVNLEIIRRVLYSLGGIKEPAKDKGMSEGKKAGIVKTVPKDIMDAWIKSGYKGTIGQFSVKYKEEQNVTIPRNK